MNSISLAIPCLLVLAIQVSAQETFESATNLPQEELKLDEIKEGIMGRVVIFGDVPDLPPLVRQGLPGNAALCIQRDVPDESFIVSDDGGLANVIVYLKQAPDGVEFPANDDQQTLQSIDCLFVPHVQVIQTNQKFSLVNTDPIACNFHIIGFESAFNLMIPAVQPGKKSLEKAIVFKQPERFPAFVQDDIYAWKRAVVLPLDHPFAAVTDKNGAFSIQGLPPGSYEFRVWHEKIGYLEKSLVVDVEKEQPTSLLLTFPSSRIFGAINE